MIGIGGSAFTSPVCLKTTGEMKDKSLSQVLTCLHFGDPWCVQVNAWKHWVVGKNAELEKQRAQGKYQKSFETDILKLRADELNFTLCMFVKEVSEQIRYR